ncbi:MAG: ABC transporter substrate-binding protein [Candidatus Binatia bacterium]
MSYRIFCCILTCLFILSWSGHAWAAESKTLTVVSYPARPPKLPLWLARDERLFAKHGLNVFLRELSDSEDLLRAIRSNEGDIYVATANHIASGIGDGADLVFVANSGHTVIKFLSRPTIEHAADLRGKKVGTGEAGSTQDRLTRQVLKRLGLDPDKDVILVPIRGRSVKRLDALLAGEIDATTTADENVFDLERKGALTKVRILADNESLKLFIGGGVDYAVSRRLLKNDREGIKAFLSALCEAISLARKDRSRSDTVYQRYQEIKDPAQLDFMYRTYVQGAIPQRPYPRPEAIALGVEEFAAKAGLRYRKTEDLIDRTLLEELEREGLFERLYGTSK